MLSSTLLSLDKLTRNSSTTFSVNCDKPVQTDDHTAARPRNNVTGEVKVKAVSLEHQRLTSEAFKGFRNVCYGSRGADKSRTEAADVHVTVTR